MKALTMTDRRSPLPPHQLMTDAQHRDYLNQRLEKGESQFSEILSLLKIQNDRHDESVALNKAEFDKINAQLAENTQLTLESNKVAKQSASLAHKISKDTSGIVAFEKLLRNSAASVAAGARALDSGVEKGATKLTKWAIFIGIIMMIFHGQLPSWKDIIELVKK